jgi:hypothetical protein
MEQTDFHAGSGLCTEEQTGFHAGGRLGSMEQADCKRGSRVCTVEHVAFHCGSRLRPMGQTGFQPGSRLCAMEQADCKRGSRSRPLIFVDSFAAWTPRAPLRADYSTAPGSRTMRGARGKPGASGRAGCKTGGRPDVGARTGCTMGCTGSGDVRGLCAGGRVSASGSIPGFSAAIYAGLPQPAMTLLSIANTLLSRHHMRATLRPS